jgi:hypothetical protein
MFWDSWSWSWSLKLKLKFEGRLYYVEVGGSPKYRSSTHLKKSTYVRYDTREEWETEKVLT